MKRSQQIEIVNKADVMVGDQWRDPQTEQILRILGVAIYNGDALVLFQRLSQSELIEAVEAEQFHQEYLPYAAASKLY